MRVREAGDDVWGSVERVADDGMTQRLGVDADLVGAAGLDADLDEGEGPYGVCGRSTWKCETAERPSERRVVMRVRRTGSRAMGSVTVVSSP